MCLGLFRGTFDFMLCSGWVAIRNIGSDRFVKQQGILGNKSNLFSQVFKTDVFDVDSVDGHRARLRIEESQQQVCQRCLAASVRTNNSHRFTMRDFQRNPIDGFLIFAVGKRDVVEDNLLGMV